MRPTGRRVDGGAVAPAVVRLLAGTAFLAGVVTVAVGFNGLALVGVPSFVQFLFQGLLLIAAVAFSSIGRRLSQE